MVGHSWTFSNPGLFLTIGLYFTLIFFMTSSGLPLGVTCELMNSIIHSMQDASQTEHLFWTAIDSVSP